ncbi:MAG TPA: FAD binding domain-containing protein [Anaerolineales bacterium]|nr:FAD binding domain-containing protein [Anaerolineales bacterium]
MILEYQRPKTIEDALKLLGRDDPLTRPMGGGTVLNQPSEERFAVLDLQELSLDGLQARGNILILGATLKLGRLLEAEATPQPLKEVVQREGTPNLRQMASVAGALVSADGRSPFAVAMLALDAILVWMPGEEQVRLADLLLDRGQNLRGKLIVRVEIPTRVKLAYLEVARTPADLPIVCAALAQWPSGRTRLALGGYGNAPSLAMDGPEPLGLEQAARSAYAQAEDEWASAEYRQEMAALLAMRCLEAIG